MDNVFFRHQFAVGCVSSYLRKYVALSILFSQFIYILSAHTLFYDLINCYVGTLAENPFYLFNMLPRFFFSTNEFNAHCCSFYHSVKNIILIKLPFFLMRIIVSAKSQVFIFMNCMTLIAIYSTGFFVFV